MTTQVLTRNTFGGVVRSEWIKLLSLRSIRFTIGFALLMGIGIITLVVVTMLSWLEGSPTSTEEAAMYLIQTLRPPIMFLGLLFGVLGVFAISSEYSSGMILSTLAATPNRGRVFAAKLLVVSVIAVVAALIVLVIGQLITLILLPEAAIGLTDPMYLRSISGIVLFLLLMTIMSFGIAGVLRNTAGGITVVAVLTFVMPIAFSFAQAMNAEWVNAVMVRLPLLLGESLSSGVVDVPDAGSFGLVAWGEAAITMTGWALVCLIPAFILFLRRDAK